MARVISIKKIVISLSHRNTATHMTSKKKIRYAQNISTLTPVWYIKAIFNAKTSLANNCPGHLAYIIYYILFGCDETRLPCSFYLHADSKWEEQKKRITTFLCTKFPEFSWLMLRVQAIKLSQAHDSQTTFSSGALPDE